MSSDSLNLSALDGLEHMATVQQRPQTIYESNQSSGSEGSFPQTNSDTPEADHEMPSLLLSSSMYDDNQSPYATPPPAYTSLNTLDASHEMPWTYDGLARRRNTYDGNIIGGFVAAVHRAARKFIGLLLCGSAGSLE